ncbi:MAG: glucose-methanol-choline oxidoreductase [Pelagibacterium sp. SCN 63-23]|nr:MAG: glucose-methanol-choline oxidoreductase [Pelagibacterium sp. SCN 63-23]
MGETEFDVIIVGAGAGGGVAACVLAEAGKRVLLIERGLERQYGDSGHRDHLRNHRMPLYGHNTGPDLTDNPRVAVGLDGTSRVVSPIDLAYHNNASCVGSGTFVYGGMAWRFHPDDFKMASRYGVPDGSSLADWPLSYEDLAPWYERAEWEIGVAGAEDPLQHGARTRGYPMPPLPRYSSARILERGAEALGLPTFSPPLLINSVRRDGRPACIECGTCVGFPCPSDAKNGTQNTAIPRAIATGRCTLVTGAMVTRVETDDGGRVLGVRGIFPGELHQRTIRARAVVLSCGAIESARLLLNSASSAEPRGLGNAHDLVGRNLQGHIYPTVFGLFDEPIHAAKGPGVTIATTAFNHGNSGIVGGAVIADDFVMPPITFWRQALPGDLRRWGNDNKRFMRDNYSRVGQLKGPIQEIPSAHARVSINPATRDAWHVPVAELSGIVHEETMRTAEFIASKADQWLKASGATKTWRLPLIRRLSAGQHQAGTCRMGTDPTNSVTDSHGRVWGHKNLFVCDASLHPTNGGFNPVLTIMAMAFRNAEEIARSL